MYSIGCSGVITHVERLDDGRFNIVLRGMERFRIVEEDRSRPLSARHRGTASGVRPHAATTATSCGSQRAKLESLLAPAVGTSESDPRTTAAMSDEDLVNALAQYLGLEPLEKQALIEQESLRRRAESLVELLEMKIMMARTPGLSNVAH